MKRIRKLVRPTDDEVARGKHGSPYECPYGLAANRALRDACGEGAVAATIGTARFTLWFSPGTSASRHRSLTETLPGVVTKRIKAFDGRTLPRSAPWPGFYLTIEVPE